MTVSGNYAINGSMMDGRQIEKTFGCPIVLVGMMGSGKTRLGRMLARVLDLPFTDTDDLVVAAAGVGIPQIFATKAGEAAFRQYEANAIRQVLLDDPVVRVISTGGGAVMRPENADLIFGHTISIWMQADIEVLLGRVGRHNDRPLLQTADPEKTLRDMAEIRYPVYRRADLVVDTGHGTPEQILAQTLRLLEERSGSCNL